MTIEDIDRANRIEDITGNTTVFIDVDGGVELTTRVAS